MRSGASPGQRPVTSITGAVEIELRAIGVGDHGAPRGERPLAMSYNDLVTRQRRAMLAAGSALKLRGIDKNKDGKENNR